MQHLRMRRLVARLTPRVTRKRSTRRSAAVLLALLALVVVAGLLVACGAGAQGARPQATSTAVPTLTPSPTSPPTSVPTATPQPTHPPLPLPLLDVRPSSMSIVGHLDCTKMSTYVCQAEVLSRASNQQALHWSTSSSVPGQVSFSPSTGVLAPGQSTLITISVPLNDCTHGLFSFHGPANTHTISWAC
jgi:hypothetical protein